MDVYLAWWPMNNSPITTMDYKRHHQVVSTDILKDEEVCSEGRSVQSDGRCPFQGVGLLAKE